MLIDPSVTKDTSFCSATALLLFSLWSHKPRPATANCTVTRQRENNCIILFSLYSCDDKSHRQAKDWTDLLWRTMADRVSGENWKTHVIKGANTADSCGEPNGWIRVNQRKHNLFLKVTAGHWAPVKQEWRTGWKIH